VTTRSWAVGMLAVALNATALAAQEAVEAEAGGSPLFSVNVALTIWTIVVFFALFFILKAVVWPQILGNALAREQRIQAALDEAARRQIEAAALLEQHRAQLADARRQAQEIVNEGKVAGERVRKEIEEKARTEGQGLIDRAKREIEREKDVALGEIRKESVDLALAAAARLIHEKLDPEKDRRLVVGYLDELAKQGNAADRAKRA
jgi:F-type H+-transporting ATPase subunit b